MKWKPLATSLALLAGTSLAGPASASPATATPMPAPPIDYMTAPFTMTRILDWGSRPDWSADGRKIAFTENDERDTHAYEIDLASREVRCVTCHLGMAGLVTRIYYLPDGSYLFLAPRNLGTENRNRAATSVSNVLEQELYWMPKEGGVALQPLGAPAFGEIAISRRPAADGSLRIAWGSLAVQKGQGNGKLHLATLSNDGKSAKLLDAQELYDSDKPHHPAAVTMAETYGFAQGDRVVTFYTILKDGNRLNGEMMAIDIATGKISPLYSDPWHNESHLFTDERFALEETNRASDPAGEWRGVSSHGAGIFSSMKVWGMADRPDQARIDAYAPNGKLVGLRRARPFDLFVVRIDGKSPPRRLTALSQTGAETHQSAPAPDGRRIAFAVDARGNPELEDMGGLYLGEFTPSPAP